MSKTLEEIRDCTAKSLSQLEVYDKYPGQVLLAEQHGDKYAIQDSLSWQELGTTECIKTLLNKHDSGVIIITPSKKTDDCVTQALKNELLRDGYKEKNYNMDIEHQRLIVMLDNGSFVLYMFCMGDCILKTYIDIVGCMPDVDNITISYKDKSYFMPATETWVYVPYKDTIVSGLISRVNHKYSIKCFYNDTAIFEDSMNESNYGAVAPFNLEDTTSPELETYVYRKLIELNI